MDTSKPNDPQFNKYYDKHLQCLKLAGLQPKTIEAYSRAIRRIGNYFDCRIDKRRHPAAGRLEGANRAPRASPPATYCCLFLRGWAQARHPSQRPRLMRPGPRRPNARLTPKLSGCGLCATE